MPNMTRHKHEPAWLRLVGPPPGYVCSLFFFEMRLLLSPAAGAASAASAPDAVSCGLAALLGYDVASNGCLLLLCFFCLLFIS